MQKLLVTPLEQLAEGGLACQMKEGSASGMADKSVRAPLNCPAGQQTRVLLVGSGSGGNLVRLFLFAVGCFSTVGVRLLLSAMTVVTFGLAVFIVLACTMVFMALEKLARDLPPVLFAGRGEHDGYGKDCGGNTGLHVGPSP
ncbi:hypothetical protein [Roseimicrobium sp. ORNL1]|uniref:hypothetical protein n=1 Tax=Roseimicrobium sp. ORNL1 TaxID=2711231 RepID=UPI0013E126D1|nr:hypothetical protein [Roseimicrobium sp. ORNL1]QIF03350.1 hypothetical protein G5S37_18075 [Roseimicrobium sp. ORNL1]